jgi:tRNA pseudouridine32 synthase/23S rRNA pseudouridine746 synthase
MANEMINDKYTAHPIALIEKGVFEKVKYSFKIYADRIEYTVLNTTFVITIVYKDDKYLVIDKPWDIKIDLNIHATAEEHDYEPNIMDLLIEYVKHNGISVDKLRPLHQLDHATSGILIYALNKKAASRVAKQFMRRQVSKEYEAILSGHLPKIDKTVRIFVCQNEGILMRECESTEKDAKECVTHITVLDHGYVFGHPATLVRLKPLTGRTHQLRLTTLHLGHPIFGDYIYNSEKRNYSHRMMLHARSLTVEIEERNQTFLTESGFRSFLKKC